MPLPQHGLLGSLQQEEQQEARGNEDATTFIIGQDLQIAAADLAAVQDKRTMRKSSTQCAIIEIAFKDYVNGYRRNFPNMWNLAGLCPLLMRRRATVFFLPTKAYWI
jgi:hypothetical protein